MDSPLLDSILADVRSLADEGDELHVIRLVLDRLLLGRRGYGPLRVDDPARSWPVERAFELVDATMYGAFELVKLQRAAVTVPLASADTVPVACIEFDHGDRAARALRARGLRAHLGALMGDMTLEELQAVDRVCVEVMRRREDQEEGGTER